jgi:hypothetical protein
MFAATFRSEQSTLLHKTIERRRQKYDAGGTQAVNFAAGDATKTTVERE